MNTLSISYSYWLKLYKAKFLAKEYKYLTIDYDLKFNRGIIYTNTTGITFIQEYQYKNLRTVSIKNTTTISSRGTIY
jgi:hypothetical protein